MHTLKVFLIEVSISHEGPELFAYRGMLYRTTPKDFQNLLLSLESRNEDYIYVQCQSIDVISED